MVVDHFPSHTYLTLVIKARRHPRPSVRVVTTRWTFGDFFFDLQVKIAKNGVPWLIFDYFDQKLPKKLTNLHFRPNFYTILIGIWSCLFLALKKALPARKIFYSIFRRKIEPKSSMKWGRKCLKIQHEFSRKFEFGNLGFPNFELENRSQVADHRPATPNTRRQ